RARLRRDGIFPTEVAAETAATRTGPWIGRTRQRVPANDVGLFTRQLGTLIAAGVPMGEALAGVGEQTDRPGLGRVLSHVRDRVTQGSSLADALAEHPTVFADLY